MPRLMGCVLWGVFLCVAPSLWAQARDGAPPAERVPTHDPTGGAYTAPTALFIPAAALPTLNTRARAGLDVQPGGSFAAARPFLDVELGLGRGFTVAAGTLWVGGDPPSPADALSPYGQLRYQFLGQGRGTGLLGGASLSVKANGFRGGAPEVEASVSMHLRATRYELGLQGTFGQGLDDRGEHDLEARFFAAWRVAPSLALGVSTQFRFEAGTGAAETAREARCGADDRLAGCYSEGDLTAGATAGYTAGRYQLTALVGGSSIGLARFNTFVMGFYSQLAGSVRF
ncbi:MAG: hypothetical protein JNK72_19365 [Myxococcales bacterium]|nr:hypothetical protein [Myxococcales bacterium]